MSTSRPELSIREFLLAYASTETHGDTDGAVVLAQRRTSPELSEGQNMLHSSDFRTEVLRHDDRTMTILSRTGLETMTRCGVCPKNDTPPCDGLRRLALLYAQHPAYRQEWHLEQP